MFGGLAVLAAALCLGACTDAGPGTDALARSSTDNSASSSTSSPSSHSRTSVAPKGEVSRREPSTTATSQPPVTPTTVTTSTTFPASIVTIEAVAQAWQQAAVAFADAAYTDDWQSASLAATHLGPQLQAAQQGLRYMKAADVYAVGQMKILGMQVTITGPTTAVVVGCLGGTEIDIDRVTGHPVPGDPGQDAIPDICDAEMVLTKSGWMLAAQTVEEGKCPVS
ncbi:MAG: hypothetical protein WAM97_10405 [Acidimicrobiales bacterium]